MSCYGWERGYHNMETHIPYSLSLQEVISLIEEDLPQAA
jgi:hypothetical protein